ncbi:CCR4-NOT TRANSCRIPTION COMPLEX RELATED domain containing protein,putative [Babesia bigemina]|uniref:CCR4-NOT TRANSCRIPTION COMPLEX RELATED domain containing protein,putative n=1 Tax=Babesia bigemina TaxID=5866 RepID=A0A061D7J5_BABBI|nr:CCR4-NOT TRANSCRIPTION COMPLEX RELATED domain containing protein,putative [Babesia bigemina]CDR95957.1 CCR4-NOT TRANSCRIPTION COMPLEX RELATED domain containing protein,putative [Babesia bigemina]|eukprot:XP_012768143.1 CCR4-NOT TRANSCRIPTION COMPLEX RELATED domain containing protein,putative [Babesia bigemina]
MNTHHKLMDGYKAESYGNDAEDEMLCPLCMEVLDETDRNFYPCTCDYQVCLWCLHYIRTTMGNKCPACRRDYEEANMKYKTSPRVPTTSRSSNPKKKREAGEKDATTREERSGVPSQLSNANLKEMRVIQRNLVYVVGIPARIAKMEILKQHEYFGQYGRIQHMVINKSQSYNSHMSGASYTAYITYSRKSEAALAIQSIDGSQVSGRTLRASYGTTKYCSFFLKGLKCTNIDCFYLHQYGDESERISKNELTSLMHKTSKSGLSRTSHGLDTHAVPKGREEHSGRHPNPRRVHRIHETLQSGKRPEGGVDTYNAYPAGATHSDRDTASWAHVAAGMRDTAASVQPSVPYIYPHPEEMQFQYSVVGEAYPDGYAHSYDQYRPQRAKSDYQAGKRVKAPYQPHESAQNAAAATPTGQSEVLRHLFTESLISHLQRYNRGEHILYAVDMPANRGHPAGSHSGQQADGAPAAHDAANAAQGRIWMMAEDAKASGAYYVSNRRRQLDYYKGANDLFLALEGENAIAGTTAALDPKDIFSDSAAVEEILEKVKQHTLMLRQMSRMYAVKPQPAKAAPQQRSAEEKQPKEATEAPKTSYSHPVSTSSELQHAHEASAVAPTKAEKYVTSILFTSPQQQSQLEADIKLHEELVEGVQKLLHAQLKREQRYAKHMADLYAN